MKHEVFLSPIVQRLAFNRGGLNRQAGIGLYKIQCILCHESNGESSPNHGSDLTAIQSTTASRVHSQVPRLLSEGGGDFVHKGNIFR